MPNTVHQVILNYTLQNGKMRIVPPSTIKVAEGDSIHFERGAIPPGFTAFIKFLDPQFFSRPTFDEGEGDIVVRAKPPARTSYQCGLKQRGALLADTVSGPSDGGDIDPAGDTGS